MHNNWNKINKFFMEHFIRGITRENFYIQSFVFDIYALVIKNLNPFFTGKKSS